MTGEADTLPLIRTKLYRPRITADLVSGSRHLERLERRRERPLTLIVAPAGYGKTTQVGVLNPLHELGYSVRSLKQVKEKQR